MTTSSIFEIYNDFLAFKDPTQMLSLATHLEVFSSPSLSDGKVYTGSDAPEAFRDAIRRHAKAKKSTIKIGKTERVGDDTASIFVSEISNKRDSKACAISINLRGDSLIAFVETAA